MLNMLTLYLHDYLIIDYEQSDMGMKDGGRESGGRSQDQRVVFAIEKGKEIQNHIGNS